MNATRPMPPLPGGTDTSRWNPWMCELDVTPADDRVRDLCIVALSQGALTLVDLQTIRDLATFCGGAPFRAEPALLLIGLLLSMRMGSPCLHVDTTHDPAGWMCRILKLDEPLVPWVHQTWHAIREHLANPVGTPWQELVASTPPVEVPRPVICTTLPPRQSVYFQRYFFHEQALMQCLARLLDRPPDDITADTLRPLVLDAARYHGFALAPMQSVALALSLRQPFCLMTGGPGTGKTTIVCSLLRAFLLQQVDPARIALVAPTGRAAQRMGEAIRHTTALADGLSDAHRDTLHALQGLTIHRLLRFDPIRGTFRHDATNPLPLDALIMDEVSMIDLVLMHRLLEALPATCRVVLLGDPNQLPSVEAGTVLGTLIPPGWEPAFSDPLATELESLSGSPPLPRTAHPNRMTDRVVRLTQSHRNRGALQTAAAAINAGEADAPIPCLNLPSRPDALAQVQWTTPAHACLRIGTPDPARADAIRVLIRAWTAFFYQRTPDPTHEPSLLDLVRDGFPRHPPDPAGLPADPPSSAQTTHVRRLFARIEDARILTLLRHGPFGAVDLNRHLAEYWRPRLDPHAPRGMDVFAGAPVLVTRNVPERELFNGDLGIVVRSVEGGYYGLFQRGERFVSCPVAHLPEHEIAFAVTIHKSQGSQYGNVLLVLPPTPDHPLLTRELLYTGITRATNSAFLAATEPVLRSAIRQGAARQTGMDLRILLGDCD